MGNTNNKVGVEPEEEVLEHQWELPPPEASYRRRPFVLDNRASSNDESSFNFDAVVADRRAQFSEECYQLPRGGYVVKTSEGPIQFGMPPDTIKDHLLVGLEVPIAFVVYGEQE